MEEGNNPLAASSAAPPVIPQNPPVPGGLTAQTGGYVYTPPATTAAASPPQAVQTDPQAQPGIPQGYPYQMPAGTPPGGADLLTIQAPSPLQAPPQNPAGIPAAQIPNPALYGQMPPLSAMPGIPQPGGLQMPGMLPGQMPMIGLPQPGGIPMPGMMPGQMPPLQPTPPTEPQPILNLGEKPKKKGFLGGLLGKKKKAAAAPPSDTPVAPGAPPPPGTDQTPRSKGVQKKLDQQEQVRLKEAEKRYREGMATIRDLIAPSSMEVTFQYVQIGDTYCKTFFVYSYPRYIEANWLSPIINFDVTMDISMFIYPSENAAVMKVLRNKVAQMQSSIHMNQEKGMVRDPAIEAALQDAEELRDQLARGQEKFFHFGLYFTIYSDDPEKIKKVQTNVESILGGKLVLTRPADLQQEHGFNSVMPICTDEIEIFRNMNTSPLSTSFPFTSSELTSNEGILYGLNRHNDSLVIFDRFTLENANSVIFAKSGAGKSYAIKLEVLRYMMMQTDVIIIDPENEYEKLCTVVGGTQLKVSLNSDRRINPFDLPKPLKDEVVKPGDLLRANIITLHGLFNLMMGKMNPTEEGLMDRALLNTYALRGISMDTENPGDLPPPTMEDLQDVLEGMAGAESLAERLEKYTRGTFSGLFNQPTNVDMDNRLIVFQIRDLEDALRPVAIFVILNYIWNRVRSSLKRRILVIDEAWSLIQHEDSAKFLYGLVKRARKYYLGVTTITQDVEDFLRSDYGKPIITNSSLQLLLKQSPSSLDSLQKCFNLTEGEKYLLLNSGVGQGIFFAGLKHVAIQIIASYTEDKIITTNPEEVLKEQQAVAAQNAANAKQKAAG